MSSEQHSGQKVTEQSLLNNPVVQKSIRRLKKLGLKVYVEPKDEDSLIMVVDNLSIIETIKRMVNNAITYKKHDVVHDRMNNVLVIAMWRGERPKWVETLKTREMLKSH
jgi:soluble P-type ATPase